MEVELIASILEEAPLIFEDGAAEELTPEVERESNVIGRDSAESGTAENPFDAPTPDSAPEPAADVPEEQLHPEFQNEDLGPGLTADEIVAEENRLATAASKVRKWMGKKIVSTLKFLGQQVVIVAMFQIVGDVFKYRDPFHSFKVTPVEAGPANAVSENRVLSLSVNDAKAVWNYVRVFAMLRHVSSMSKPDFWRRVDPDAVNNLDQVRVCLRDAMLKFNDSPEFDDLRRVMTHMPWYAWECDTLVYIACLFLNSFEVSQWNFNVLTPMILYADTVMSVEMTHSDFSQLDAFQRQVTTKQISKPAWKTYAPLYNAFASGAASTVHCLQLDVVVGNFWANEDAVKSLLTDLRYLATHTSADNHSKELNDKYLKSSVH